MTFSHLVNFNFSLFRWSDAKARRLLTCDLENGVGRDFPRDEFLTARVNEQQSQINLIG